MNFERKDQPPDKGTELLGDIQSAADGTTSTWCRPIGRTISCVNRNYAPFDFRRGTLAGGFTQMSEGGLTDVPPLHPAQQVG